jgi:hypothetical protein
VLGSGVTVAKKLPEVEVEKLAFALQTPPGQKIASNWAGDSLAIGALN